MHDNGELLRRLLHSGTCILSIVYKCSILPEGLPAADDTMTLSQCARTQKHSCTWTSWDDKLDSDGLPQLTKIVDEQQKTHGITTP